VTIGVTALGTNGSVDAGTGTNTLIMTTANAATASGATTFEGTISNFARLNLGTLAGAVTVNLANLDDINFVTATGSAVAADTTTISGFTTGGTFVQTALLGNTSTVALTGSFTGTADSFNLTASHSGATALVNAGTLTLASVETVNVSLTNTSTTVATTVYDLNLDATSARSVVITGNTGITFANSNLGTAVTSFNASGVTGTAAAGAVTYTTAALAGASTITGGSGNDTLNAAAAVAAVTINGGIGVDAITGSATRASTLNGDAGNDTITGGAAADVIDGGADTDTYVFSSANIVEQTGASATTGVVINLGADVLTANAVFLATGAFLSGLQTTVASGTSTYLFAGESTTNVSVIDTLANIENVTGSNLADYIVGSATANTITGGAGADVMTGGTGADTFVFATGASGVVVAEADTITDFVTGTDKISTSKVAGAGTIANGTALADFAAFIAAADAVLTAGAGNDDVYISWNAFATGNAYIVIDEDDNGSVNAGDTLIILTGINLAAEIALADFL
jgi:S-layer protein